MNTTFRFVTALAAAVAVLSAASYLSVQAQAGKSVGDGVYTAEQAKRGERVYAENCGFCHGDDLKGSDVIPALTGADFLGSWKGKTAADLYEKIQTTMPATAPGTLTPAQTSDSIAHMFAVAKYPVGSAELSAKADELKQIRIDK
ncbi:MAG: cytochrome c [Acidimicrobiia bacterium]|nr:cytochrome c [Acidimicrobiia bacterium]